ncbi:hypothetical protein OG394_29890 [Kribbella sp. NBC_01245]|uniref:hypothetical protein n=1 Tax=Kribbella sp. NBC_01245 TaxID=2903578 RepID=UPI002E2DB0B4|nr:hypothetical protein [Kribbella sp. NBC_01245]
MPMDLQGVAYDTGTVFMDEESRPTWNRRQLRQELEAIDERLHANWVSVFGSEVERLTEAADEALSRGLTVSIQPRAFDRPQEYALEHLRQTACAAERLRKQHDPEVILVVGCEFMLFTPGIVPGADFYERVENLSKPDADWPGIHRRFATYVDKVVKVARKNFGGRITYGAAADLEPVNWALFDIVGLDYYSYNEDPAAHTAELAPFRQWNQPILILEFGCCTFTGAAEKGGMGWNVVDYTKDPPAIPPGVERNEAEQAEHLVNMLGVFEREACLGAAMYSFISPDAAHSPTTKAHDYDIASYALVKTIRKDHFDPLSPYRWEPKQSFHAVAREYVRRR